MGVPNFTEGSLISYEIGDPSVPKRLGNWGPGSPISYENGDPRVPIFTWHWVPYDTGGRSNPLPDLIYSIPKRTKLSTIFMVKTGSNFIVYLWSKLSFLLSSWFFHVQTYKFSWSQNILVTNFLVNLHSIPMPFHSNFMLNSVPFQQHFMVQWQSRPTCTRSQPRLPAYHRYHLSVHWDTYDTFKGNKFIAAHWLEGILPWQQSSYIAFIWQLVCRCIVFIMGVIHLRGSTIIGYPLCILPYTKLIQG